MLVETNTKTFPTKYKRNDTDYAKGWNACLNSVMQQKPVDVADRILADIMEMKPWLDGTCLVVSRDEVLDIVSKYKSEM